MEFTRTIRRSFKDYTEPTCSPLDQEVTADRLLSDIIGALECNESLEWSYDDDGYGTVVTSLFIRQDGSHTAYEITETTTDNDETGQTR